MKSIVYTKYGLPDVLKLKEVERPVPLDDEVLVEVHAASVNAYDWHFLTADVFLIRLMGGLLKPKKMTLGADVAGRVIAVGKEIKRFQAGDEVFGIAKGGSGGFAEYVCAREKILELKPSNVSFEEAAAVPMAALTALQGLRDEGQIEPGEKVLIHGASGGVGTFAVQIAKSYGANVTAVCSSRNMEIALSIGADHVIDYTRDDFTKNGDLYDLILVANGNRSILEYKRSLKPKAICVLVGGGSAPIVSLLTGMLLQWWISKTEGKKIGSFLANINQKDLAYIKGLLESGKIKSVIDRSYMLGDTAEALRYLGEGHAKGKIVVTVEQGV
ncbi:NAD(P)-dependent alcohol dehydrogenase [candidate division CSSED10-310 bacterium]|uniref:NAD(P)-dependent alcohol dehydrogenase n=1 Tax=candidate division CSSED10-310 bacterium TaxID=2855610 RepID=A0ABV6YUL0_UNCC1